MSNAQGTIQKVVLALTAVLKPLTDDLAPDNAKTFFAQLGIPLTGPQANSIAGPLNSSVNRVKELLSLTGELAGAIEAENVGDILEKSISSASKIVEAINSFSALKTALEAIPALPPDKVSNLPKNILNYLLIKGLEAASPAIPVLKLVGIVTQQDFNVDSFDPANPPYSITTFNWNNVGTLLSDPAAHFGSIYDWNAGSFTGDKLFQGIGDFLGAFDMPVLYTPLPSPKLDAVAVEFVPVTIGGTKGFKIQVKEKISSGNHTLDFGDTGLTFKLDFNNPPGMGIAVLPTGSVEFVPPGPGASFGGKVTLKFTAKKKNGSPFQVLSIPGGSKLEVDEFSVLTDNDIIYNSGTNKAEGVFRIGGEIKGGKLLITFAEGDGFLNKILSGIRLENTFDLGFGYSSETGFYFQGSANLEIQLASHITLGPIELSAITFSVGIDGKKFPISLSTDIKASLGPLKATVQGIGVTANIELKDGGAGNTGPIDLGFGFKPPKGVGLVIDAGAVKGGGYLYFDYENEEYGGALELSIAGFITAKAIGLINTRMPDGSKGFSLLIIISAEFSPPFQLGYGFTLNAVGGLLGLNRTMVLHALRDGVKTGAINSVMFPHNVVENAPKIISDLKAFFPPHEGKFLIGPMAKIGWGIPTLISVSFGLIIEIPGNIAILGVLRIALPTEDTALLNMQINFLGTLDFDQKMLTFDASLFDSRLLFMTLEGDFALRIKWGDNANFLMSAGGFHPSYDPPPLDLPTMARLAINILNTSIARIRIETYFAVTSNTVQFGTAAEFYFGFDGFYVDGGLGWDVLFQFSPFYFIASLSGHFTLHVIGIDVLSIRIRISLEGPTPWHAKGTGSVTILFWDIEADIDVTWGDSKDTKLPPIEILPKMRKELQTRDRWSAVPPKSHSQHISLRKLPADEAHQVLHPIGALHVAQKVVPLNIGFDKVGTQQPSDVNKVMLPAAKSGLLTLKVKNVKDDFAPAEYSKLKDAEKLSRKSFEKMDSGIEVSMGDKSWDGGKGVKRTIEYETTIIDHEPKSLVRKKSRTKVGRNSFSKMLSKNFAAKSAQSFGKELELDPWASRVNPDNGKLAIDPEGFTVAFTENNKALDNTAHFSSEAMAMDFMKDQVRLNPEMKNQIHVVPSFEVVMS